jgi:hypothetical protein
MKTENPIHEWILDWVRSKEANGEIPLVGELFTRSNNIVMEDIQELTARGFIQLITAGDSTIEGYPAISQTILKLTEAGHQLFQ